MSWYKPNTVREMVQSTRNGHGWTADRFGLAGQYVAVLSFTGMGGTLDSSHPLSDHVLTGAERYQDDYMAGRGRIPHPSVTVYYVRDLKSRRVVLARQEDGTILDELDTIRPDLRPVTRDALRKAIKTAAIVHG